MSVLKNVHYVRVKLKFFITRRNWNIITKRNLLEIVVDNICWNESEYMSNKRCRFKVVENVTAFHHNHKASVLTKKKLSYVLKQNSCVDKVPSPIHFIYAVHHEKEE